MTRPEASTDIYRTYFERGLELDEEAKAMRAKATTLNKEAENEGADPGALALARRLRRIPDLEKRRAKLRAFAQVLVELEDEILEQQVGIGHNSAGAVEDEAAPEPASPPVAERRACAYCGDAYTPTNPHQKYCDKTCKDAHRGDKRDHGTGLAGLLAVPMPPERPAAEERAV